MKPLNIGIALIACIALLLLLMPADTDSESTSGTNSMDENVEGQSSVHVKLPTVSPKVIDTSLVKLVDKTAKNRVTNDMSARYPSVKHEKDFEALAYVLLDVSDEDTIRHEVANLLRRSDYKNLTNDLIRVLNNPAEKERFRNFAVQHIYLNFEGANEQEQELIRSTLLTCLEDRHPAVQREALLALHRINDPLAGGTAEAWLTDSTQTALHDIAIRVLRERANKSSLPIIRKMATQEQEVIAIAAIVTLGEWQDQSSEEMLVRLKQSGSQRLKRACDLAIKRIRGELPVSQRK